MKRKLFALILCTLILTVCVSAGAFDYTFTASHNVVVKDNVREISFHSGDTVTLDKSHFVQDGKFDYLVLLELPEKADGTLFLGNREAHLFEKIKVSKLNTLHFVATADFDGSAQFCYRVTSGKNQSAIRQMNLVREEQKQTVLYDTFSMETMVGISVSVNLPAGSAYQVTRSPKLGEVSISDTGECVYTPLSKNGNDKFDYEVLDEENRIIGQGTVKVSVEKNQNGIVMLDMQNRENHLYAVKLVESGVMTDTVIAGMHFFNPTMAMKESDFVTALTLATGISVAEETLTQNAEGDALTKAKAMVMVYNLLGLDVTECGNVNFEDSSSIPDWAYQQVCALSDAGIVGGSTISASDLLTREQAVSLIYNAAEYVAENQSTGFWEAIDVFHFFH